MHDFACEACGLNKLSSHYGCSAGCNYFLCADCAECQNQHLLTIVQGFPPDYNLNPVQDVFCNKCNTTGLAKQPFYYFCEQCQYVCCVDCQLACDWETERFAPQPKVVVPQLRLDQISKPGLSPPIDLKQSEKVVVDQIEEGQSVDYEEFAQDAPKANHFDDEMLGDSVVGLGQSGKFIPILFLQPTLFPRWRKNN